MSTPNPTRIIAEHLHADTFTARNRVTKERAVVTRCLCGDTVPAEDFAEHVVSELTDAGYSIVQLPELDDLDCVSAAPGSGKVRCYLDDARMTADDARDLAGLLLAAAAAAEGEKP